MLNRKRILKVTLFVLFFSLLGYFPAKATAMLGLCDSSVWMESSTIAAASGYTSADEVWADEIYVGIYLYVNGASRTSKHHYNEGTYVNTYLSDYATFTDSLKVVGSHSVTYEGLTESINTYDYY